MLGSVIGGSARPGRWLHAPSSFGTGSDAGKFAESDGILTYSSQGHAGQTDICTRSNRKKTVSESGRVGGGVAASPLPSEPDVRVSPHPAQADAKPRESGAGSTTV